MRAAATATPSRSGEPATRCRRPSEPFDVCGDTRSQAYRGADGETARTTDAVTAARAVVLKFGASVARTFFHASSGGRTAAVVARAASGRAATGRVTGTLGTRDIPGTTARSLFGLRSASLSVTNEAAS